MSRRQAQTLLLHFGTMVTAVGVATGSICTTLFGLAWFWLGLIL